MKQRKILFILGALGLYLLTTGVSYALFGYLSTPPEVEIASPLPEEETKIDLTAPKTEECPLNGGLFTKGEKNLWEKRRPLGVMVENHVDSRPQSGLSQADVVYEGVAEGGITRFLALFYCQAAAHDTLLGPIRSARTYYLDWVSEYDASFVHVGGASCHGDVDPRARALCQIDEYGIRDIDQMGRFGSYPYFWRDYEKLGRPVATEHTMHSTTDKLWEVAEKAGYGGKDEEGTFWQDNFRPWKFKEDEEEKGKVEKISFSFWKGYSDYQVVWEYKAETNEYQRLNGGQPHLDFNTQEPLTAKVVVVQKTKEIGPVDAYKHLLYQTEGQGQVLVFQDGEVIEGQWVKKDRAGRTIFYDSSGREIKFNRGRIWLEIVPAPNKINY